MNRAYALVLLVLTASSPISAADLAKIDRSIAKEPAYQSKAAKYSLLVFGPEAKTRVWLVQDGGVLYVDRNGNGDLTEPGERVEAKKGDYTNPEEAVFYFEAGHIPDGKLTHKNLTLQVMKLDYLVDRETRVKAYLAENPTARGFLIGADVELPGRKGQGIGGRVEQRGSLWDGAGILRFGDKPSEAPVLHFGGPWHILPNERQRLVVGRETELVLGVGTPGVGPGTTVWIAYEGVVPQGVSPTVEITYAPKKEGEPPISGRHELKDRC